jgi:hypothetical protein
MAQTSQWLSKNNLFHSEKQFRFWFGQNQIFPEKGRTNAHQKQLFQVEEQGKKGKLAANNWLAIFPHLRRQHLFRRARKTMHAQNLGCLKVKVSGRLLP